MNLARAVRTSGDGGQEGRHFARKKDCGTRSNNGQEIQKDVPEQIEQTAKGKGDEQIAQGKGDGIPYLETAKPRSLNTLTGEWATGQRSPTFQSSVITT